MAEYLSQDSDYYDVLRTKLGDLQGADTLIHELTQNAHDAFQDAERTCRASYIAFDICDDGLRVTNDGIFSSCGDVGAADCRWLESDPEHELCDFHRFRRVAGGDKAKSENVFGAFGVGFISVYQVTDEPELWSNGMHWTLSPARLAHERILSEPDEVNRPGTVFWLPWAPAAGSNLGTKLRRPPIDPAEHIHALEEQGPEVAERAIMFLQNIDSVEILRNGKRLSLVTKTEDGCELVVNRDGVACSWLLLRGDFAEHKTEADAWLAGQLQTRSAVTTVAIPEDPTEFKGLLFCGLPTRQPSLLPFHVDANFFPSSDRKRIDVEGESYQVEWNLAALRGAARAVAANLELIGRTLGHTALWSLIWRLYAGNQRVDLQDIFWGAVEAPARSSRVVFSSRQEWRVPTETLYLRGPEEEANLPALEGLGLEIAHPDLRPYQPAMVALDMKPVGAQAIANAVGAVATRERIDARQAHAVLADDRLRLQLGDELSIRFMPGVEKLDRVSEVRGQLRGLALCLTLSGHLALPRKLIAAPSASETAVLSSMGLASCLAEGAERNGSLIRSLVSSDYVLKTAQYVATLADKLGAEGYGKQLGRFFGWLHDDHLGDVRDSEVLQRLLLEAAIWPSNGSLRPLDGLSVPGGFSDWLGLAETVDAGFAPGVIEVATILGCQQLDVLTYAIDFVPSVFEGERPADEDVRSLLTDLASCLPELTASEEARRVLSNLPLAPCSDGEFRRPRDVLFDSPDVRELLGQDAPTCESVTGAVRPLLEWLGANSTITVPALVARVRLLAAGEVDDSTRRVAQNSLRALTSLNTMQPLSEDVVQQLRQLAWMPAVGDDRWHQPQELLTVFQREMLFGDHGLQLDCPRARQREASDLLRALGCRQDPWPDEAIDYLEEMIGAGKAVPIQMFQFLDRAISPKAIQRLAPLSIFLGSNGKRFGADRAFLGSHPFGDWAVTLEGELAALSHLLEALRVKREPSPLDAARILAYIEYELGEFHYPLEASAIAAVNACWSLIGTCSQSDQLADVLSDVRSEIEGRRTALDADGVLVPPYELFFNDQPALAKHLEDALGAALIPRIGDSWRGLALCGTSDISEAIAVEDLRADATREATEEFRALIEVRRAPILRAMAQDDRLAAPESLLDRWLELTYVRAANVSVRLTMARFRLDVAVDAIKDALLDRSAGTLYVVDSDQFHAAAIARELLTGAGVETGHLPLLITAVEQVLAAPDAASAQDALDVRGFARFEARGESVAGAHSDLKGLATEHPASGERSVKPGSEQPFGDAEREGSSTYERDAVTPRKPQRREERLKSWVAAAREDSASREADSARHERDLEIGRAGVARVVAYERSKGRKPEEMSHFNKGYDVTSEDDSGHVRFIEVKSTTDLWGVDGVGVTPAQHDYARRNPDEWWLYVVEAVESETDWAIYCVNNFVERTYRYMFDDGWRVAAKEKAGNWRANEASIRTQPPEPEVD